MFYLTNLISSDYDVCGICSQFLVLGQPPSYEVGELSLLELQEDISAQYSVLEGKSDKEVGTNSENFTEDLELILYALPEKKQKKKAEKIVCKFKYLLLSHVKEI